MARTATFTVTLTKPSTQRALVAYRTAMDDQESLLNQNQELNEFLSD